MSNSDFFCCISGFIDGVQIIDVSEVFFGDCLDDEFQRSHLQISRSQRLHIQTDTELHHIDNPPMLSAVLAKDVHGVASTLCYNTAVQSRYAHQLKQRVFSVSINPLLSED